MNRTNELNKSALTRGASQQRATDMVLAAVEKLNNVMQAAHAVGVRVDVTPVTLPPEKGGYRQLSANAVIVLGSLRPDQKPKGAK